MKRIYVFILLIGLAVSACNLPPTDVPTITPSITSTISVTALHDSAFLSTMTPTHVGMIIPTPHIVSTPISSPTPTPTVIINVFPTPTGTSQVMG